MLHTAARDRSQPLDLLIVDDEADTRELLGEFCTTHGFRTAFAADGRAAVTALQRSSPPFPVVIADLNLPQTDGFAVLEAARRANDSCYVVIVTGYASIDAAVRAVRHGAYDFLAKPFVLGQLELVLNRIRDRMALESRGYSQTDGDGTAPRSSALDADTISRIGHLEDRVAALETLLMRIGHRPADQTCREPDTESTALTRPTR